MAVEIFRGPDHMAMHCPVMLALGIRVSVSVSVSVRL